MVKNLIGDVMGLLICPDTATRWIHDATSNRFRFPLARISWVANALAGRIKRGPRDIEITDSSPGLRVAATVDLFGTDLRASAVLRFNRVALSSTTMTIDVAVSSVLLRLVDEAVDSPVATLIRSGVLDFRRPGNLVTTMPFRPAIIQGGKDDVITLDLSKSSFLARRPQFSHLVAFVLSVLAVDQIDVDSEDLRVKLRYFPEGVGPSLSALRRAI